MAARPNSWEVGDDSQMQRMPYHARAADATVTDLDQDGEVRDSLELHNRQTHGCRTRPAPSDQDAPLDRIMKDLDDIQFGVQHDQAPAADQTGTPFEQALELREGVSGYHTGPGSDTIPHEYDSYERYMSLVDDAQIDGGRDRVTATEETKASQETGSTYPCPKPANSKPRMCDSLDGNSDEMATLDELIDDLESVKDVPEPQEVTEKDEAQSISEELLQTSELTGLAEADVISRRRAYGFNQLEKERHNHLKKVLGFFVGPIQFVMQAAAILAAGLRKWIDLGVICALLLLNAGVGFIQEFKAGSIVHELKKTLANKCTVMRGGDFKEIEARFLVPGDIVSLEEGSIVPADGRIVTPGVQLQVDQSAITGESLAANKHTDDTLFQSSTIKRGEANMIVTAIGDKTFIGRSAALVTAAASGAGHFTEVINRIGSVLLVLVVITLIVVWISSFFRSTKIVEILKYTLAITIVGVPVGLPAVVTTTMAVGASFLAKKKAIVQRLSAIESLAGVEILCSDKTGTLTKNKLSLGKPYVVPGVDSEELMLTACLAASQKKNGLDAIDKAFMKALRSYDRVRRVLTRFKTIEFTPFDPVSKKVTAIVETPHGERVTCVKGAPAIIMSMVLRDHTVDDATIKGYTDTVQDFASRGFRSLGVARRRENCPWEIMGIVPCLDPPRDDTAETISEAKNLGLKIKMLTGDAVGIAKETSRQLGLGDNIYNSERLGLDGGGTLPGSKMYDFVEAADGFAEVYPQHKHNVIEILQKRGYLVAMTGDGVNDAPSLKKADTGIAVEGASDAARSAADIVFLAPGLSAIIDALKTSRQIFHRMYAYVVYRIALSLHLLLFLGLWITIQNKSLNLTLVVFIAIFADVATLAIAYDHAPFSQKPVKWNLPKLWGIAMILGMILTAGTWICLGAILIKQDGGIIETTGDHDGILFLQISLTENWLIFITRAAGHWKSLPSWQLASAILIVDIVATLFCIFGWFVDNGTDIVTVVKVWIFSLAVFCVMAGVYYLLSDSKLFDDLMHGRLWKGKSREKRSREDFVVNLQRVSTQHERVH